METPRFAEVGFRPAISGFVPRDLKPFLSLSFRFRGEWNRCSFELRGRPVLIIYDRNAISRE